MRKEGERFVILRHDAPAEGGRGLHWDLMLEMNEGLKTWALSEEPLGDSTVRATALADHRKAYLDYEGPVSNDRGDVTRWDAGTFKLISSSEDEWLLELNGDRIRGPVRIHRTASHSNEWLFSHFPGKNP